MMHLTVSTFLLQLAAGTGCDDRLLISDYTANNVRIYDACSGDYLRNLDTANRLRGPQATRIGSDGLIYVVSEENNRVVRYRTDDFSFVDVFISDDTSTAQDELGGVRRPTGLAFANNGDLLVAGFSSSNVVRFDGQTGAPIGTVVTAGLAGLDGPDAGLALTSDNVLLVPSFENSTLYGFDAATGAVAFSTMGTSEGILDAPRVALLDDSSSRYWVTSWRSGKVVEFSSDGTSRNFANIFRASGLTHDPRSNDLIAVSDSASFVWRIDRDSGATRVFIDNGGSNPLQAATFVTYLEVEGEPVANNDQYWIVGDGTIDASRVLRIGGAVTSSGGRFGAQFVAEDVTLNPWGELTIEFMGCTTAVLTWQPLSSAIAPGTMSLQRLLPNRGQSECEAAGFDQVPGFDWISGTWYGGPERSGEGILIDVFGDNQAFVAWFSYIP